MTEWYVNLLEHTRTQREHRVYKKVNIFSNNNELTKLARQPASVIEPALDDSTPLVRKSTAGHDPESFQSSMFSCRNLKPPSDN